MNSLIAIATILLFLLVHKIEIGHSMMPHSRFGGNNFEVGESSSSSSSSRNERGQQPQQQQSSSGIIQQQQQRRGWEKIIFAKRNSHFDPPIDELAAMLALFDWLANYGNEIFEGTDDNIVKNPSEIFDKIIGGHLDDRITKFVLNFNEFIQQHNENPPVRPKRIRLDQRGNFIKIKYPNTRTMLFQKMLYGAMSKVQIPQFDKKEENDEESKKRRIEEKYTFQFGLIMDCIYANYYQTELEEVNYDKIVEILQTKNFDEFRRILLENNCANKQTVDVFIQSIMSTNMRAVLSHYREDQTFVFLNFELNAFFVEVIKQFLNSMIKNNILEEEYSFLKFDPYLPEELPKIANLVAMVKVFISTIKYIIELIKPVDLDERKIETMLEILKNTIGYIRIIGNLMHFIVVTHGKHYKMAMNNIINNPNLRINMSKLKGESFFSWILDDEHEYNYWLWFKKLKLRMAKYVAEECFGLNIQQNLDKKSEITKQIAQHIIQKYFDALRNEEDDGQNLNAIQIRMEERKKKRFLLEFLHLRIFCIGIRQKINIKEEKLVDRNSEFKELYKKLDLELLDILPGTKAIVVNEIMPALETDGFLNENEGVQFVDMDKLFKKALPIIRDRICRLK